MRCEGKASVDHERCPDKVPWGVRFQVLVLDIAVVTGLQA
jgi:hypothetical protein